MYVAAAPFLILPAVLSRDNRRTLQFLFLRRILAYLLAGDGHFSTVNNFVVRRFSCANEDRAGEVKRTLSQADFYFFFFFFLPLQKCQISSSFVELQDMEERTIDKEIFNERSKV